MKPIRTTIIFALFSTLCLIPFLFIYPLQWGWPITVKTYISLSLAIYCLLLCRWSNTGILSVLFPLLLLFIAGLWPHTHFGSIAAILFLFCWIRSGICFNNVPVRAVFAEIVTMAGGAGFILFWWSHSPLILLLAVWFFFLVQSLYFFIVPLARQKDHHNCPPDPFDRACGEMERLLENIAQR